MYVNNACTEITGDDGLCIKHDEFCTHNVGILIQNYCFSTKGIRRDVPHSTAEVRRSGHHRAGSRALLLLKDDDFILEMIIV